MPEVFIHRANKPPLIKYYLNCGYGVEIDVRIFDNKIYSGHDAPTWLLKIDDYFNFWNMHKFLFHCKDLYTYQYLMDENYKGSSLNIFFQDKDLVSQSSDGHYILHSDLYLNRPYRRDEIPVLPKGDFSTAYGAVLDYETIASKTFDSTKV